MPNTVQYKDWLFVRVESIFYNFRIGKSKPLQNKLFAHGRYDGSSWELPSGSWQIIGKADTLKEEDWWNEKNPIIFQSNIRRFKDYTYKEQQLDDVGLLDALLEMKFETATESGHSLLKSLGMEPSTTIILQSTKLE